MTGREPKPAHLGPQYGAWFQDERLVGAYPTRPPYAAETFEILQGLVSGGLVSGGPEAGGRLLDVGHPAHPRALAAA